MAKRIIYKVMEDYMCNIEIANFSTMKEAKRFLKENDYSKDAEVWIEKVEISDSDDDKTDVNNAVHISASELTESEIMESSKNHTIYVHNN